MIKVNSDVSATNALVALNHAMDRPAPRTVQSYASQQCIPKTSYERRRASLSERPFDISELLANKDTLQKQKETILYLGYGSNLAAETFLGKRGIKPLSQMNVVVPSLQLAFNLPGIPYREPCFANTRLRNQEEKTSGSSTVDYHKNAWKKGLVGVVYEVTQADYAHIIATEGGGSGYQDVVVDCYTLSDDPAEEVPVTPQGKTFKAHTLFAPPRGSLRQDPDYAQPSPRYLKLITDGAAEHKLPNEYRAYLADIRSYHTTTTRQKIGAVLFAILWGPIFMFLFKGPAAMFLRPDGTYPKWFRRLMNAVFTACWGSYDNFFHPSFGDGERTIGNDSETNSDQKKVDIDETAPLLPMHMKGSHENSRGEKL